MPSSQKCRHVRTFSGRAPKYTPQALLPKETYEYNYITQPFTLDRQSENDMLRFRKAKSMGLSDAVIEHALAEWSQDPMDHLCSCRFWMYLHFVAKRWCECSQVSWKIEDILSIDNIEYASGDKCRGAFLMEEKFSPIIRDLNIFLANGGTIPGEEGCTLEQTWFIEIYKLKIPFFSVINKVYREEPSSRISHKYFADAWGIVRFLHHLMLWEIEYDSDLLQGAPYKPDCEDMFHKYIYSNLVYNHFPCLVYDNMQNIGHVIEILYWNKVTRRFVFFDPWPDDSLLNSFQEVVAFSSDKVGEIGNQLWEIEPADLERAVFSIFVPFKLLDIDFLHYGTESKYFLIPYEK